MADVAKGRRITGDERRRMAADLQTKYSNGASIRALAEETGRSYGFIHRVLLESGTDLRGRGGPAKAKAAQ